MKYLNSEELRILFDNAIENINKNVTIALKTGYEYKIDIAYYIYQEICAIYADLEDIEDN